MAEPKLVLTLYVVAGFQESDGLVQALNQTLSDNLVAGQWKMNVIDVLSMPHKAIENDIFVTPTLVRELPEPVLKFMGAISNSQDILAIINNPQATVPSVVII